MKFLLNVIKFFIAFIITGIAMPGVIAYCLAYVMQTDVTYIVDDTAFLSLWLIWGITWLCVSAANTLFESEPES